MPREYIKKPVVVEAIEWDGSDQEATKIVKWIKDYGGICNWFENPNQIVISTLEGNMIANPNDFIIRGVVGEFYPCKPSIFHKTYQDAETKLETEEK